MPTNLNQLVSDILLHHSDSNFESEEARKKVSSEIVEVIMSVLEGDDQIQEFQDDNVTIFLSDPTVTDVTEECCSCGCDCDEDEYPLDIYAHPDDCDTSEDPFVTYNNTPDPEKTNN